MIPNGKIQLLPLLRVALAFVVGITAGDMLMFRVPLFFLIVATVVLLGISFVLWGRPLLHGVSIMLTTMFLGAWFVTVYARGRSVCLPDREVCFKAVVAGTPVVDGKVARCDLFVTTGRFSGCKVRASLMCDSALCRLGIGDGVEIESLLEYPRNYRENTNFDYRRWMEIHGFVATMFVYRGKWRHAAVSISSLSMIDRSRIAALRIRERLLRKLRMCLGVEHSVVAAMTLGDKSSLTGRQKELYSVTGASHLLALSGLHIGVIYIMLSMLFAGCKHCLSVHVVVVSSIWAYSLMTGLSPGVVRASTMFTVYSAVVLLNRSRMSANTLAFAAVVMLAINPLYLWDAGFQMSFMAVLGILVFYSPFYNSLSGCRVFRFRLFRWLWAVVSVSMAAQIGVAPLVMYYFGRFSCYFLLTNVLAVPVATFIIYCSFVLLLSAPLPLVQNIISGILVVVVRWFDSCLFQISCIPGASIENISIRPFQVMLIYLFIACIYCLGCYVRRLWHSAGYNIWK